MKRTNEYNIVDFVVDRMRDKLRGHWSSPDSWKQLIADEGCGLSTHKTHGLAPGQYLYNGGSSIIFYSISMPAIKQARVLCHELAHHFLMNEPVTCLFERGVYGYEGTDIYSAREQMVMKIEFRFFGPR